MVADDAKAEGVPDAALAALEKLGGRRGQQAVAALAAAQVAWPVVKWVRDRLGTKEYYTIVVDGTDAIYNDLHEWVLARMPEEDRKAMIASTSSYHVARDSVTGRTEAVDPRVRLRYDGSRTQTVRIGAHEVDVQVEKEPFPGGGSSLPENWRSMLERITFRTASPEGRDAVVAIIDELVANRRDRKEPPPLLLPSRWGGDWNRRSDLPPRKLDSVALKAGQLERLVEDLRRFLESEDDYNRCSQPWHRGYLFHGPPGTGKTSVARALADHFEMPLHYLPLGDLEADADLMGLVSHIRPKSMLLLEDVDAFHAAVDRDEEEKTVTVAAMLNALDGVWTPHGLVTVMTTNHKERLDDALIRAGRIDVDEELGSLDAEQGWRLAELIEPGIKDNWMPGHRDVWMGRFVGKSPADLIQAIRSES